MAKKKNAVTIPRYDEALKEWVPIDSIQPLSTNARVHTDEQLAVLRESIQRFGLYRPLVVHRETRQILAGNGVYTAARQLGLKEVPVVWYDGAMPEALALCLTDNRTAELSEWDYALLVSALSQNPSTMDALAVDAEFEEVLRSLVQTPQDFPDLQPLEPDEPFEDEDALDDTDSEPPVLKLAAERIPASKTATLLAPEPETETEAETEPSVSLATTKYALSLVVRLTDSDYQILKRWARRLNRPCDESVIIEVLRRSETLLDAMDG